ncbi:ATP-binding protein [Coraliomargarita sp. SDUM461004]|uniref:histidine kinase n=1 Tax=Thalassobacterium sedimentorum TaxID=3041258 RepID=A0ABU1AHR9_9BACT|nr:ATP-binding protein [Coraliomargarita sp. SDUM461004]MDQ8194372.1 ATP-binding protein [Coraliomargarita sp. SDUM461004]
MLWFLTLVLLILTVALSIHILRLRRLFRELDGSVRSRRRLLLEDSAQTLRKIGAFGLVESLNELVDSHNQASAQESGYSSQVEAMLGAVQEVVIVFNGDRVVEYANRSAERLFRDGQSIQGLRLEGVFRSLTLLELLDAATDVERTGPSQIRIEQDGETLWFEASCAKVIGMEPAATRSTLLVLHDITKLKALEVMRREFVANVSHELRTPLTIIKGFAETLIDDEATIDPKSRSRFTLKILNNAERLHVLVEDLLTLSRIESRPDQIEPIEQPLRPLLDEVAENYRTRLNSEHQRIEVKMDANVGALAFDRYRINQVLDNFIENVFRYAPDFTCIQLVVVHEEALGQVRCLVIDDGPGIPEKDLPHLFERFYRVDKGRSRETGGTGLGLSIVKHIVQLHGGTVQAESTLGEGTRMSFTLPFSRSYTNSKNT